MVEVQSAPTEAPPYKPPKVEIGQHVYFYANANTNEIPQFGVVVGGGETALDLVTLALNRGVQQKFSVKHVSDPALERNPNAKKDGAWDFTAQEKAFRQQMVGMTEKIAMLMRNLKFYQSLARDEFDAMPEADLRVTALERLGDEYDGRWGVKKIVEMLRAKG